MILPSLIAADEAPADWERRRGRIAQRLRRWLGPFGQEPVPLETEVVEEIDRGDFVQRRLRYCVAAGDRASAWLLIPKRLRGPAPTMLCFHGTTPLGKDRQVRDDLQPDQPRGYALRLARRGYVCLAPDYFLAGERLPDGGKPYDKRAFYARFPDWSAFGKGAYDGMRDVDLLLTLDEVDPQRIGAIGHSLGGDRAVHTAVYDPRVALVVCSCGLWPEFGKHLRVKHALGFDTRIDDFYPLMNPRCREAALAMRDYDVELHETLALIAPRPLLLSYAFNEIYTNNMVMMHEVMQHLHRLYAFLGVPERFAQLFHGDGHNTLPWVQDMCYGWIDRYMGAGLDLREREG